MIVVNRQNFIHIDIQKFKKRRLEPLRKKLNLLQDWCVVNGMKVNTDKTKFFTINGTDND